MMGTSDVLLELILDIRKECSFETIMDLGSGSGGPMIDVAKNYQQKLT